MTVNQPAWIPPLLATPYGNTITLYLPVWGFPSMVMLPCCNIFNIVILITNVFYFYFLRDGNIIPYLFGYLPLSLQFLPSLAIILSINVTMEEIFPDQWELYHHITTICSFHSGVETTNQLGISPIIMKCLPYWIRHLWKPIPIQQPFNHHSPVINHH